MAQCQSQMRQIGLAVRLYADDHEDQFPRSQHPAFAHSELPCGRAIAPQLGRAEPVWTNLLSGVYHCPADLCATFDPAKQTDLWNPSLAP